MKPACKSFLYLTFPLVTLGTLVTVSSVRAQSITTDGTLSTQVQSNDNLNFDITQGNRAGNNLFHSFGNFSVPNNGSARFQNPTDVVNIFGRVTGGNVSNINGLIQAQGAANLFLINPKGIVFGSNASLNIGGSFFASTASSILFDGGVEFSATDTQPSPLLSVNMPIGLRFRDNPGSITIDNSQQTLTPQSPSFEVKPEKTLAFVGGDINLTGRRLRAPGGRIELGALAAEGVVKINNDFSLSFPENVARADVSINAGDVDVTSGDKGSVGINAKNINLLGGSDICAGIGADDACGEQATNFGSVNSQAGDITLNALETITISDSGSSVRNLVNPRAVGNSGGINITTGSLSVTNGAFIASATLGRGDSGKININARDNVSFDNGSIINNVLTGAVGNSGEVDITTGLLSFTNGAFIASATFGRGDSGKININARDNVSFDNGSIFSNVLGSAVGNSGGVDINVTTGSLSFTNGAQIQSITQRQGNSGKININARDNVSFDNSFIFSNVSRDAVGNSGGVDITVSRGSLSVKNVSLILSATAGEGNSGNITIKATELVEVLGTEEPGKNSSISARVSSGGTGNAGNLTIDTKKLVIRSSQVGTSTFGNGDAGNLTVKASESVDIVGKVFNQQQRRNPAGLFSQVNTRGKGDSGELTVETSRLSVGNGGKIQVAVFGQGNGGKLFIRANDIDIYDTPGKADFFEGGIFAGFQVDEDETTVPPKGDFGGTVTIETDRLRVRDGGAITVLTEGEGDAGILKINAKEFIEVYGEVTGKTTNRVFTSQISAEAREGSIGNGGLVKLNTNTLIVRDRGKISAENQGQKRGGDIDIRVDELLLLRRGGTISTFSNADGGNIDIKTGVLVALPNENSDISADAQRQGGAIKIDALGIFGFTIRSQQDLERLGIQDFSQVPTNDISATGGNPALSGNITINNPEVDPTQGLVELPETVVDAKNQVAQNPCQQGAGSTFVATGRGGLPSSPTQDLSSGTVRVGLATPVASKNTASNTTASQPKSTPTAKRFVPAQGWVFNSKGQVVLTAYAPNSTGVQRTSHKGLCAAR
ncbi:MAG: filamentous hemagglutinin N-terminal domain-containing protein [Calothrix sp. MO_192.B10]|nr:filamentous hemagglutinin N-terminal domain-containing protein [Calothrix sp. MO_192.B10]